MAGNPAPYHIIQPSTNDHVQIVSPDAPRLTLMCSLNITIPSGMTITWLHDDCIKITITAQVATCSYQLFMCAILAVMLNSIAML